jgi:hypothetical protein
LRTQAGALIQSDSSNKHGYARTQDAWILLIQGEAISHVAGKPATLKAGGHGRMGCRPDFV